MASFIKVALTTDIPEGEARQFEIGHDHLVIAHTAGNFYAIAKECSHERVPLSEGRVVSNEIVCTAHGARFDLKTGAVTKPPAIVPIDTFELKIEGSDILVLLEDSTGTQQPDQE